MAIIPIEKIGKEKGFSYHSFAIFIIIAHELFEQYLHYRQMRRLQTEKEIPKELKELTINEVEYKNSIAYSKVKLQFQILVSLVSTAVTIIFHVFYYEPLLWNLTASVLKNYGYDESSEFKRALVFILIDMLKDKIISIPTDYSESFFIEERFGFNKKTIKLFVYDEVVSTLIRVIVTAPILYGFLFIVEVGGEYFYLYVEVFVMTVIFIMITIYPTFIAPLFNKFSDLEEGTLKDRIVKLAQKLDYPLKKIYIVDGSTRSSHSNAYLYGFGKNKRIVLYDTIIKHLNEDEIEAVIAHELGHWSHSHTLKILFNTCLQVFILFYLYGFFINNNNFFLSFGFKERSIFIGTYMFMHIYTPINFVNSALTMKASRYFEYQADEFARKLGYGSKLCKGLIKLSKENKSNMNPDPLYVAFKFTHPTVLDRIRTINSNDAKDK